VLSLKCLIIKVVAFVKPLFHICIGSYPKGFRILYRIKKTGAADKKRASRGFADGGLYFLAVNPGRRAPGVALALGYISVTPSGVFTLRWATMRLRRIVFGF
jgi:hypothetical protein